MGACICICIYYRMGRFPHFFLKILYYTNHLRLEIKNWNMGLYLEYDFHTIYVIAIYIHTTIFILYYSMNDHYYYIK